ncbi:MAG TPA: iron donor protein CyaY [Burkholderiales bacterium]|nr:iron donor protein CyaY [Burkholderiales bacterium]
MRPSNFEALAEEALEHVRAAIEATDLDVDVEEKGDGVIELGFADGSKIVVNRHSAAGELWIAAREGGFHLRWNGEAWRDTRENRELFALLSKLVSSQAGEPVLLAPPRAP